MTVRAIKFTPDVLISAPRRSAAIPCADGTLALYTVSTYSFQTHSKYSEIRIYDFRNGQTSLVTDDGKASEPNWLGRKNTIFFLRKNDDGTTSLMLQDAENPSKAYVYFLGSKMFDEDTIIITVTGQVGSDEKLYNPETAPKPYASGRVYDSLFVRHWDSYVSPNRSVIWYGLLQKESGSKDGQYRLKAPGLSNALVGTNLECPTPPFGGTNDYDVSTRGIIFTAKDPTLNQATTTKTDPYYLPISYDKDRPSGKPQIISVSGLLGASASPVFSPDGKRAAFLRMKDIAYESDRNRIIIVPDISNLSTAEEVLPDRIDDEHIARRVWNLSPSTIYWSNDGEFLYLKAESQGRSKLFKMPSELKDIKHHPAPMLSDGSVTAVYPLAEGDRRLVISSTSLIDNSLWSLLESSPSWSTIETISSNTREGRLFGLSPKQVSEIRFPGAGDYKVHAWVMKPSNFDERNTYPLAYLIHGGPQGAWLDSWSTRWNLAVFAEQGYVVVAPNPTGSTGYGQEFVDAIQGEWGGRPYEDLVAGFEYLKETMPYVDFDRAVALGASYGGYMVNWIQGQSLGRQFKALVTHDGVFSTLNEYSSEELWFPRHDFEGSLWSNRPGYRRWDPARFLANWETPHLIIHNELDYRLPISEGLAAFNVLQERRVKSRFLSFPDEGHWVLKPENSLQWHTVVINWINQFVGLPEYKPKVGDDDNNASKTNQSSSTNTL
ncbi:MAG: hypothetical protein M1816_002101 [Peltula sp. TS41687]|nr:MAG: hypothetical protein M1816_002101 [Peltula sp. TS41687]